MPFWKPVIGAESLPAEVALERKRVVSATIGAGQRYLRSFAAKNVAA
jgi:hypothetical protein